MGTVSVLFVIPGIGGSGGAERSLAELLPRLGDAGINAAVVYFDQRSTSIEPEISEHGVTTRRLTAHGSVGRVLELRRLIKSTRPDIVHSMLFEADQVARFASWRTGAVMLSSLVNTVRDPVRFRDPRIRRWRLRVTQALDAWTARHLTHHFHAITSAVKESAVRGLRIPEARVTVIERSRDPSRLGEPGLERRRRARTALGIPQHDVVFLNVARQEYQKGQRILIEAFGRVAQAAPNSRLVIAGRAGSASEDLRAASVASPGSSRVGILGYREDIPELLAAADIFVFPSLFEGFGGAVIEAMALGLPVIASDLPALREVVAPDVTALLIPPGDPSRLADAMLELLLDDQLRTSLGSSGRRRFLERFTPEHTVNRTVVLYRRLADRAEHATREG